MEDLLVFHDGVYLPAKSLVAMAMNARDYHTAEHYMVSLLYCAVIYENGRLLRDRGSLSLLFVSFSFRFFYLTSQ